MKMELKLIRNTACFACRAARGFALPMLIAGWCGSSGTPSAHAGPITTAGEVQVTASASTWFAVAPPFTGDDNRNGYCIYEIGPTSSGPFTGSEDVWRRIPGSSDWRATWFYSLTPGATYFARVTFVDPDGVAGAAQQVVGPVVLPASSPDAVRLEPPTIVPLDTEILFSLRYQDDANLNHETHVEIATSPTGPWLTKSCVASYPQRARFRGLAPGTDYWFRLRVSDPDGVTGAPAEQVFGPIRYSGLGNLALGKTVAADSGWGCCPDPSQLVDGQVQEADWYTGFAWCGGTGNWGECGPGWKQATIDLGTATTFNRAAVWLHEPDSVPLVWKFQYSLDGSVWVDAHVNTTTVCRALDIPVLVRWNNQNSALEATFPPVTARYFRYTFDDSTTFNGMHCWAHEIEVFNDRGWQPEAVALLAGTTDRRANALALREGSLYVAGADAAFGGDGLVAQFALPLTNAATPSWVATWPSASGPDEFQGIGATAGGVYLAGWSYSRTTDGIGSKEHKGILTKFPLTGPPGGGFGGAVWDTPVPVGCMFPGYKGYEALRKLLVQAENGLNYIYVVGHGQNDAGWPASRLYLAKLTEEGSLVWSRTDAADQGPGWAHSYAYDLAALNGHIYTAAWNYDTGISHGQLRKFGPDGAAIWTRTSTGTNGIYGLTAYAGHVFAVGLAYSGTNLVFLVEKWTETGSNVWSRAFDRGPQEDVLYAAVGARGRLYAVGYTRNESAGEADLVLLELDAESGELLKTSLHGGARDDMANHIVTDGHSLFVAAETRSAGTGTNQVLLLRYELPAQVTAVAVAPVDPLVSTLQTLQFQATGTFSDGSSRTLTAQDGVVWTSTDPSVATINAEGFATPTGQGECQITACKDGACGSTRLRVLNQPPHISAALQDHLVPPNGDATWCVTAQGSQPLEYQWQFNGTAIAGATGSCLALSNVTAVQAGIYTVQVRNAFGTNQTSARLFIGDTNSLAVNFLVSVDDYAELHIDGQLVASYDDFPWGIATAALQLSPGWHDLRIVYRNRWGSNALRLERRYEDEAATSVIPRADLRCLNGEGRWVAGLRADYEAFTLYGEGPINHGYPGLYEGVPGLWAGVYDYWALFSETLTGQVFIRAREPNITTPPVTQTVAPGTAVSLCAGATGAEPLAYQWLINGAVIEGATNACLEIAHADPAHSGTYTVQVSNGFGTATASAVLSCLELKLFAGLVISGPTNVPYTIQFRNALDPTNAWQTVTTNLLLPANPAVWIDYDSPNARHRFYQAFPTP